MTTKKVKNRRATGTGQVRLLPSGRWQARVKFQGREVSAPATFDTKLDADLWARQATLQVQAGTFTPPEVQAQQVRRSGQTLGDYATTWVAERNQIRQRTREGYEDLLRLYILPSLGPYRLHELTPSMVRTWYSAAPKNTQRAKAYSLLKTILTTAWSYELIDADPCRIMGGGAPGPAPKIIPATPEQIDLMVPVMRDEWKLTVLLGAWMAMRLGEGKNCDQRTLICHVV